MMSCKCPVCFADGSIETGSAEEWPLHVARVVLVRHILSQPVSWRLSWEEANGWSNYS